MGENVRTNPSLEPILMLDEKKAVACGGEFYVNDEKVLIGLARSSESSGSPPPLYVEMTVDVATYSLVNTVESPPLTKEELKEAWKSGNVKLFPEDSPQRATFAGSSFRTGCARSRTCLQCHTTGKRTMKVREGDQHNEEAALVCADADTEWPTLTIPRRTDDDASRRLLAVRVMWGGQYGQVDQSDVCLFIECTHDENVHVKEL